MNNGEEADGSELIEQFISMDEDEGVPFDWLAISIDEKARFNETVVHTGEDSGEAVNTSSYDEKLSALREEANEELDIGCR
ncbi:hypothetical protein BWQ96_05607 [Gracilariopsis chorda]|uniref:Uncharacterized protein n=1 Tax=Gracilariopsis chorda TaxID=448386 RepID=A0A2V3IR63_9FLOR|nr:hypothetical protein BWQ96_05607 [Gracilariopsis chorda]|eukprot:PXF44612.1 hypothetical protein BWQ96_05607 [Gracilariopsis chorda]